MRLTSTLLLIVAMTLQSSQTLVLKGFEVLRVSPDDLRKLPNSMRAFFVDPVPDGFPVDSIEEAAKRVGFTPHVLSGKTPKRLFVTNPVNDEAKINVAVLTTALRDANVANVTVPADWDGVTIGLQQKAGVLIDYGDFYIAEGPPKTLTAPAGFPVAQCMELLFRVMGVAASESRSMRDAFATNAASYLPIAGRFDMDIRHVPMPSGSGLLLQNADKGGELAFMWTTGDRSYFLTGLVPEDQVIAIANSLSK
jgi:hypothetical protein